MSAPMSKTLDHCARDEKGFQLDELVQLPNLEDIQVQLSNAQREEAKAFEFSQEVSKSTSAIFIQIKMTPPETFKRQNW